MIYLIGKIVLSLLASLGIGFGMAWALQMHLAARLREQLNSVIFETKSRIPQLESEITNRDQTIDGLREELAKKPKADPQAKLASNKEQEKQIDELRQQIIDLENDLRMARGATESESVFELDDEDRHHQEEPELMSDDEFLTDIQDIFEEPDDSAETETQSAQKSEEETRKSLEDELQSELDGWEEDEAKSTQKTDIDDAQLTDSTNKGAANAEKKKDALPPKRQAAKKTSGGSVDLKAELLNLEDEIRAGSEEASIRADTQQTSDFDALRGEVESLSEARKQLNDIVDTQAKEMTSMQQQRELQDKSLTVLNQQLELARMANERILRELREVKDANPNKDDTSKTASGG